MQFAKRGFLGENNKGFAEESHKNHKEIYCLIEKVSRLSKNVIKSSKGINLDRRQMVVICMLLKLLSRVENVISITEKGSEADAVYLLRGVIEGLAVLKCSCEQEEFIDKYLGNEVVRNKKLIEGFTNNKEYIPAWNEDYWKYVENILNRNKEVIKEYSLKGLKLSEICEDAGLKDIYITTYACLCKEVHFHPTLLMGYFFINDNKMVDINTRQDKEAAKILTTVSRYTLIALKSYCAYMKLSYINEIDILEEGFSQILGG